jgi:hypothetical protein
VADDVGQVLEEIAAASDIQHLQAAADRENWHVPRQRALEQRELGPVALRPRASRGWVRLGTVRPGLDIGAAG